MVDRFKADFEKTAVSYQQQIINKIWAQAGMKALAEIADIYPRMTSIHDSSLFDIWVRDKKRIKKLGYMW